MCAPDWAHPMGKACFTLGGWLLPNFKKTNKLNYVHVQVSERHGDLGLDGDLDAMYVLLHS